MSLTDNLFFDGDLQAGISLAIANDKKIVCFVTGWYDGHPMYGNDWLTDFLASGNNDESLLWQDAFLRDDEVVADLASEAITLRIQEHSVEAGHLSAYYQVSSSPTVILIQNFSQGQLLLEIKSGSSKDHFKHAILDALKAPSHIRSTTSSDSSTLSRPSTSLSSSNLPTASGADLDQNASPPTAVSPTLPQTSTAVQDLLHDRRQRLEAERKEKDAAEKARQRAKAGKGIDAAPDSAGAKKASYAQQQRKRQHEEKLEHERIMRDIEHDKTARREKEEHRRALAKAEAEGDGVSDGVDEQLSRELGNANSVPGKVCALQVRLFDGSTIRRRFAPNETLRDHVRAWIDKEGADGDSPFTFKQILNPMPNRNISISDEDATLQSIGLMPSATLIKIPVQRFSDAYVADQGIISRGISASYNVASAGVNMITGLVRTVLGFGQAIPDGEEPAVQVVRDAEGVGTGVNIRSLRHQDPDRREQEFYNGNQLNFEPRRDNEDA
ncbi:hypothetical protein MMC29_007294 [Sticta canariensis]|nr:hypothetical protein [Sticta canariensis]